MYGLALALAILGALKNNAIFYFASGAILMLAAAFGFATGIMKDDGITKSENYTYLLIPSNSTSCSGGWWNGTDCSAGNFTNTVTNSTVLTSVSTSSTLKQMRVLPADLCLAFNLFLLILGLYLCSSLLFTPDKDKTVTEYLEDVKF